MGIDFRRPRHIRGFRLGEVLIFDPGKALVEKTASGSIAHITDGADGVPLKNWGVTVDANLSGVSAVECTQTKKNLIDNSAAAWENGNINTSGGNATGAGYVRTIGYYDIGGGMSYEISGIATPSQASDFRLFFYDETKTFISYKNYGSTPRETPANARYMRIRNVVGADMSTLQIEYGTTATAYEAYTAPTVTTVSLGRTIYGGEVDIVNGEGNSTHGMVTLTAEMINSATSYSYQSKNGIQIASVFPVNVIRTGNHICSAANVRQGASSDASYMWFGSANGNKYLYWIGVLDTMEMTLEQWKTWALSQTIVCVYEEPTSTDFTFTPITPTPETAIGTNNFWADEGDSKVTYYAYAE